MADPSPTPPSPEPARQAPADPAAAQGIQAAPAAQPSPPVEQPKQPGPTMQEWVVYRLLQVGFLAVLWVVCNAGLCYFFQFRNLDASILAVVLSIVGSFFLRPMLPTFFHSPAEKYRTTPPPRQQAATQQQPSDSREIDPVREILETVVFVVVLVLMLKTFVAEAFVIPTGSMAETLYGYQKLVVCPSCKYEFPLNASDEVDPESGKGGLVLDCTCPNCRLGVRLRPPLVPVRDKDGNEMRDSAGEVITRRLLPSELADNEVIDGDLCWCGDRPIPGWRSGDRVLVSKFTYDLPGRDPERLDVVVFKFPGDEQSRGGSKGFPFDSGPIKNHAPMNYIKRLVGKPGETIAIHRGKLYVLSPEKAKELGLVYDNEAVRKEPDKRGVSNLWRPGFMHRNDKRALELFNDGKFEIVRKPAAQVKAMMRVVFDHDFQPKDLTGVQKKRWVPDPESGWTAATDKTFAFEGKSDDLDWLHYRHALRGNDEKPSLITDFMGYNTGREQRFHNWASDLILECDVDVKQASGEFALELSKGVDRFRAVFDLATGECSLVRIPGDEQPVVLKKAPTGLKGKGSHQVRFANVDDRLLVWVDGRLPFGEGVEYAGHLDATPTQKNDLERPASIGARKAANVTVSHLRLFRDTYYTTAEVEPQEADVKFTPWDPSTFGDLARAPVATLHVQPDHYLCMGDNSPASSDGRTWGLVPRRLMLGRALLVYYPFQRAGRIR